MSNGMNGIALLIINFYWKRFASLAQKESLELKIKKGGMNVYRG
jgi:hypothetical protein